MVPTPRDAFIDLALARGALRFGQFTLKSGRISPYFFNAGLFNDGAAIATLGECYAATLAVSGMGFDMLFGPAYKGIPLVTATAIALATRHGRSVPWAFNRKEAKDHGEGGLVVGSPLAGRVVIIDDTITAGTAVRESVDLIRRAGAEPVAVALALDRQERGRSERSAVQEMREEFGVASVPILGLDDLLEAMDSRGLADAPTRSAMHAYRRQYGVPR